MDGSPLSHKVIYSNSRTGTFHQTCITTDETTCSANRALCHHIELKDDRITTLYNSVNHTFGYFSEKFMHVCAKSSVDAHSTEISDGNFKHFKTIMRRTR